jgi:hypothetical protein
MGKLDRTALGLVAALVTLVSSAHLLAHDVVVEQVVTIVVSAQNDRLLAQVHVPVSLLDNARLPRRDDGTVDRAASDSLLPIVAADVARNLDFKRGDASLRATGLTAHLASDARSIDVELSYALTGPPIELSARLNAFEGTPLQPPRTDVTLRMPSGPPQHLSIAGPPTRVALDPGSGDVVRQFAARALDATLAGGDYLLFLICLLLPARTARGSGQLVAIVLGAQTIGLLVSATTPVSGASRAAVEMVAWSAVAAAALCGIAGASARVFASVGVVFGLLSGVGLGATLGGVAQFSGSHAVLALRTFVFVAIVAELWLAAVMLATRQWLASVVAHPQAVTIVAAALVAHAAVHRVLDRGRDLEQSGSFVAGHAVSLVILAWTVAMVVVALLRFARGERAVTEREAPGGAVL